MFFLKSRSPSMNKPSGMSDNSSIISTDSSLFSNASTQTLVASPPKRSKGGKLTLPDYAEMLEDDNMAWGPPKSRRH